MKQFRNIHAANTALPDLGRGEVVVVSGTSFRVAGLGHKVLKRQGDYVGEAAIGFIPGDRHFNKTSGGGKSTSQQ